MLGIEQFGLASGEAEKTSVEVIRVSQNAFCLHIPRVSNHGCVHTRGDEGLVVEIGNGSTLAKNVRPERRGVIRARDSTCKPDNSDVKIAALVSCISHGCVSESSAFGLVV